jgi:hypothetical protein
MIQSCDTSQLLVEYDVDVTLKDLIRCLLEPTEDRRLGFVCGEYGAVGAVNVQTHTFYDAVDWTALEMKRITPPSSLCDDICDFNLERTNGEWGSESGHEVWSVCGEDGVKDNIEMGWEHDMYFVNETFEFRKEKNTTQTQNVRSSSIVLERRESSCQVQ